MSSSKKIALLCDHFLPHIGGIELHVRDLALHLHRRGQKVHIITPTPGEDRIGEIPVHRLKVSLLPRSKIIWNFKALRQLKRIMMKERFDLIHAHSSVMSPFAYGSILFFGRALPSVVTTHSLLNNTVRVFRGLHAFSGWGSWPVVLSGVSGVVAQSLARASKRDTVAVLPNGIDLSPWFSVSPISHEGLRVTTVMRLHRKKRPEAFLRAIPYILTKFQSNPPLRFTIIGDGPERSKLEALSRRLGIGKQVEFLGYRPREEIKKVFAETDLFVLPTVKEAFGIALLEARAAGLPIVAMNFGGTGDILQDGVQGFLAKSDEEFGDRITQLLIDHDLRRSMSRRTRGGLERFGWDPVISQHLEIYDRAEHQFRKTRFKEGSQNESLPHHRHGAGLPSLSHDLPGD